MSLEAIETLSAVEDRLRRQQTEAVAAAKQSVADAKAKGETLVEAALQKARQEVSALTAAEEKKGKDAAATMEKESRKTREALRSKAEKREEEAVSFVVERIVNG